mmetsp:Transcript_29532/g.71323  ORF Transcript_29532/g.71323 Transcript_29532/m.71323 type:complete len:924 (+) Transcript_29532:2-2773(+)
MVRSSHGSFMHSLSSIHAEVKHSTMTPTIGPRERRSRRHSPSSTSPSVQSPSSPRHHRGSTTTTTTQTQQLSPATRRIHSDHGGRRTARSMHPASTSRKVHSVGGGGDGSNNHGRRHVEDHDRNYSSTRYPLPPVQLPLSGGISPRRIGRRQHRQSSSTSVQSPLSSRNAALESSPATRRIIIHSDYGGRRSTRSMHPASSSSQSMHGGGGGSNRHVRRQLVEDNNDGSGHGRDSRYPLPQLPFTGASKPTTAARRGAGLERRSHAAPSSDVGGGGRAGPGRTQRRPQRHQLQRCAVASSASAPVQSPIFADEKDHGRRSQYRGHPSDGGRHYGRCDNPPHASSSRADAAASVSRRRCHDPTVPSPTCVGHHHHHHGTLSSPKKTAAARPRPPPPPPRGGIRSASSANAAAMAMTPGTQSAGGCGTTATTPSTQAGTGGCYNDHGNRAVAMRSLIGARIALPLMTTDSPTHGSREGRFEKRSSSAASSSRWGRSAMMHPPPQPRAFTRSSSGSNNGGRGEGGGGGHGRGNMKPLSNPVGQQHQQQQQHRGQQQQQQQQQQQRQHGTRQHKPSRQPQWQEAKQRPPSRDGPYANNDPRQRSSSSLAETRRQLSHAQEVIALANPSSPSQQQQQQQQQHEQSSRQGSESEASRHRGFREDCNLGESARSPSHMIAVESDPAKATQLVDTTLRSHDFAFVRRSDGTYTYAILAYRTGGDGATASAGPDDYGSNSLPQRPMPPRDGEGEEGSMTFVLSGAGCTKLIRRGQWADFIRLVADPTVVLRSSPHVDDSDGGGRGRRGTMAAAEERPHPVQTKREDGTDNNNTSNSRSAVGDELVEVKSDHDVEEHLERLRREFYSTWPASVGDGWLPPANIAFDPDDDDNISCVSTQSDLLAMASDTAVGVGGQAQDATARYAPSQPMILE